MRKWERFKLWNWTGFRNREDQLLIVLSLVIGIVVGLDVVAFILAHRQPGRPHVSARSAAWRRVFMPTVGALFSGYLLYRYFPERARQRHPANQVRDLFIHDGYISAETVWANFSAARISLASGIALGARGRQCKSAPASLRSSAGASG